MWYKSTVANMTTVQIFEIISGKFNVDRMCTYVISSSVKKIITCIIFTVKVTDSRRIESHDLRWTSPES
jgi:hypothetical protein